MDKTYYSHTGKIYKIYLDSHNFEDRVELDLNNYYISNDGDKVFAIKLPETYEECCVVLGLTTEINLSLPLYQEELFSYYKLLVCRNAWYKVLNYDWESDSNTDLSIVSDPYGYFDYSVGFDEKRNTVFRFPNEKVTDMF